MVCKQTNVRTGKSLKYFIQKECSAFTPRRSTSERSLKSVNFAKTYFHWKAVSKSTLLHSLSAFTSRQSTPKRSLKSVNFAKTYFHWKAVSKSTLLHSLSAFTSRQSTSKRSLKSVNFAKTYFHWKAVCKSTLLHSLSALMLMSKFHFSATGHNKREDYTGAVFTTKKVQCTGPFFRKTIGGRNPSNPSTNNL